MKKKKMALGKIIEYENNPRVNEMAIESVVSSIDRYGYNQPMVVDEQGTLIVGHTRLRALRRLVERGRDDLKKVDVLVSEMPEELAREHRIVDNKTGEKADWYLPYLRAEVREMEEEEVADLFDEHELGQLLQTQSYNPGWEITEEQIEEQRRRMEEQRSGSQKKENADMALVKCAECGEQFYVRRSGAAAGAALDAARKRDEEKKTATAEDGEE